METSPLDLGAALAGSSDTILGVIGDVLPLALPIALGVIGLTIGWRFFKRIARG